MRERQEIQVDFGDVVKHEARLKLWLPALKELKDELGKHLKYFTLPGPKAYDVIKWKNSNLIRFDGRGYPDVCFCEMDHDNYINAKRILGKTRGIKAKFEKVIRERQNPKYKAFWDFFPYDVYNLDFCGTWFENEEPLSDTFRSIIKLVNHHVSRRNFTKFLLFLTIRIDKGRTNPRVIEDLKNNLELNSRNSRFLNKVNALIAGNIAQFIERNFHRFILVSLPKLIAFKFIPQTKRFAGTIESIGRGYYLRNRRYHIGKFVFLVGKKRTSLRINPSWYENCVCESLEVGNIIEIVKETIPHSTKRDLVLLKNEIARIESYG